MTFEAKSFRFKNPPKILKITTIDEKNPPSSETKLNTFLATL